MSRTRILYCEQNTDGTIGGSYFSLLYLIENLDKDEYHPFVVFYTDHDLIQDFRRCGAEVFVVNKAPPFRYSSSFAKGMLRARGVRTALLAVQSASNFFRMLILPTMRHLAFLRKHRIELVHLNNSIRGNHDWMIAARMLGLPCVTHERGINERFAPLARFLARGLDAIICISDAVKSRLEQLGIAAKRIVRIYNGLDADKIRVAVSAKEIRGLWGLDEDAPVIGIVGNVKYWKGQKVVVSAMALLRERFPKLKCLVVGATASGDEEYLHQVREAVAENGLLGKVIMTGYQANVADYINIMDIVIHASVHPEPFGRIFLEAGALKKVVIATNIGAAPEIVLHGRTGLLVPPDDPAALSDAIAELLPDGRRRQVWGEAARARLLECFTIAENVARTEKLYDAILEKETRTAWQ